MTVEELKAAVLAIIDDEDNHEYEGLAWFAVEDLRFLVSGRRSYDPPASTQ